MEEWGILRGCRNLLHDRDTKFCASFRELIESGSVRTIRLPARSPNLNSFAERWVRSVKEDCMSKLILFGERSLRRALQQYVVYYHEERNHQGKENLIYCSPKLEELKLEPKGCYLADTFHLTLKILPQAVNAHVRNRLDVLGTAYPDERGVGIFAYVFYNRVQELAHRRKLGHALLADVICPRNWALAAGIEFSFH